MNYCCTMCEINKCWSIAVTFKIAVLFIFGADFQPENKRFICSVSFQSDGLTVYFLCAGGRGQRVCSDFETIHQFEPLGPGGACRPPEHLPDQSDALRPQQGGLCQRPGERKTSHRKDKYLRCTRGVNVWTPCLGFSCWMWRVCCV